MPLAADRQPFPVVETMFDEANGQFSPDGKWIAFQSDETGRTEIWIQPFPAGQRIPISRDGGVQPRWHHNGELFYLAPGNRLMVVPIRTDAKGLDAGAATPLFTTRAAYRWWGGRVNSYARHYSVAPDGQRFLVDTLKEVTLPIKVLQNWNRTP